MSSVDHPSSAREQATTAPPARTPTADQPMPALDQPFDSDALFTLRSAVAAHATDLGAGRAVDDTVLVAHELASNAVRHGGGTGRLRLWRTGDRLFCEVSDSGTGLTDAARAGSSRPSPTVPGGRGLWIVRQLADMSIESDIDGTTITAVLHLRAPDER